MQTETHLPSVYTASNTLGAVQTGPSLPERGAVEEEEEEEEADKES